MISVKLSSFTVVLNKNKKLWEWDSKFYQRLLLRDMNGNILRCNGGHNDPNTVQSLDFHYNENSFHSYFRAEHSLPLTETAARLYLTEIVKKS